MGMISTCDKHVGFGWGCTDRLAVEYLHMPCPVCRAEKAEAEVERLRKLCVYAYNEGYEDGCDSVSRYNIGELRHRDAYWNDSITKADLDSAAGRGEPSQDDIGDGSGTGD